MAQVPPVRFEYYSINEGWPGHYTNKPLYDKHGYLWIPTSMGLYRYDGYEFKHYAHKAEDSTSLSSNFISTILINNDGTIWVGTSGSGLNLLDTVTGKCKRYRHNKADPHSLSSNGITYLFKDSKNRLWIGVAKSNQSINVLPLNSNRFIRMNYKKEENSLGYNYYEHTTIRDIKETADHKILFGTLDGLWAYNDKTQSFKGYSFEEGNKRDPKNIVSTIEEGENGAIWVGTLGGGLKKLDLGTGKYESFIWNKGSMLPILSNICQDVEIKSKDELWVSSVDSSFGIFNIKSKKFAFFRPDGYNNFRVYGFEHQPIYKDPKGNIWLKQGGLYARVDMEHQPFKFYDIKAQFFPKKLPFFTTAFFKKDSTVLIGTWENYGVFKHNFNSKSFRLIPYQSFTGPEMVAHNGFNIKQDGQGHTWIISTTLFKWDTDKNKLIDMKPGPVKNRVAFLDFSVDRQNNLWIASDSGLYFFDTKKYSWKRFSAQSVNKDSLQYNSIRSLYLDGDDKVWLGFDNEKGFSIYNRQTGKFSYYDCSANTIPVKTIDRILEDKQGRIWMAGRGGITIWNKKGILDKPQHIIPPVENWGSKRILQMEKDADGTLWAVSGPGIQVIDPVTLRMKKFSSALPYFPINAFLYFYISPDNHIFIGGKNGFFTFKPGDLKENTTPPTLVMNSFKIFDEEQPIDFFRLKEKLHLKPDENYFSFEFAIPTIKDANKQQYAYKLEGFDKNWVNAGSRHYAAYTNVPGGNYIFKVKGANADGLWNEKGLAVPLFISTPWWQQWWFYTLSALVVAAVIYAFYQYRINQFIRLQQMRTQIASDLHDDVGSTLTSISFYSEMVKMQLPDENPNLKNMLDKIGNNSRTIVSTMSDIVWVINPENDITKNLISRMKNHAAEVCHERNIRCHFETDQDLADLKLDMRQRKNLYLIFKEALHNAVKYAACDNIQIQVRQAHNEVQLSVEDNGKGFDLSLAGEGNGLHNMKRRAQEMQGNLQVQTGYGRGTSVRVKLKIT